ncbi:MAG TPA: DMT family transporter [Casimicrobiaceae bacterium]|nr:DMT family transporter [Casimicrobiaceae bacterium]
MFTLTAVLLWGTQLPIAKDVFTKVDAYHVIAVRYGAALVFLVALLLWREGLRGFRYRGQFRRLAVAGVLGMCMSPFCTFVGLSYSRPEHAATISAVQPLIVASVHWSMHGRRPSRFTIGCIFAAIVGVLVVVGAGQSPFEEGSSGIAGDLLILGGSAAWVAFAILSEDVRGFSTLSFTTLTLFPATVVIFAIVESLGVAGAVTWPPLATLLSVGWELLFMSLGTVVVSMLCWNAGTRTIGALNAMLFINFQPVVTFVVRFVEGHHIRAAELVGAAVVVGALIANSLHLRSLTPSAARVRPS